MVRIQSEAAVLVTLGQYDFLVTLNDSLPIGLLRFLFIFVFSMHFLILYKSYHFEICVCNVSSSIAHVANKIIDVVVVVVVIVIVSGSCVEIILDKVMEFSSFVLRSLYYIIFFQDLFPFICIRMHMDKFVNV